MRNCDAVIVNYNAGTLLTESVQSVLAVNSRRYKAISVAA